MDVAVCVSGRVMGCGWGEREGGRVGLGDAFGIETWHSRGIEALKTLAAEQEDRFEKANSEMVAIAAWKVPTPS